MYKRMFLVLVIIAVAAGIGFAEGAREEDPMQRGWGRGSRSFDPEMIELTGTLMLQDGYFPVLTSGGEEYVLMYPYYLEDDVDVQDGDTITVEGFIAPHPRRGTEDDVTYVRITNAIIDGEEYEIPFGPRGGMGPRGWDDRDGRGRWGHHMFGRGGYGPKGYGPGSCWGDDEYNRGRSGRRW